eukprot:XP_001707472.1 Hypothetical protein GL50803_16692 [Giardia lamblia ATCC 50803]
MHAEGRVEGLEVVDAGEDRGVVVSPVPDEAVHKVVLRVDLEGLGTRVIVDGEEDLRTRAVAGRRYGVDLLGDCDVAGNKVLEELWLLVLRDLDRPRYLPPLLPELLGLRVEVLELVDLHDGHVQQIGARRVDVLRMLALLLELHVVLENYLGEVRCPERRVLAVVRGDIDDVAVAVDLIEKTEEVDDDRRLPRARHTHDRDEAVVRDREALLPELERVLGRRSLEREIERHN